MDPFTKDLGVHQGRVALATAPEGGHVYELGHVLLQDSNLGVGDLHQVSQELVLSAQACLIRASIRVEVPRVLPPSLVWEVSALLNGQQMVRRALRPSKRPIFLHDWRISLFNANHAPSTDLITFRLSLIAPGGFG